MGLAHGSECENVAFSLKKKQPWKLTIYAREQICSFIKFPLGSLILEDIISVLEGLGNSIQ